jgi:CheY-like chemotaxis protein
LILEDDAFLRQLLGVTLHRGCYAVTETTDGSRAWEMLQRQRIQMVLTDWMMPMTCSLMAGPVATQPPRSSSRPGQVRLQRHDRCPDGVPDSEVLEFPLLAHSVGRRGAYAEEAAT